MTKPFPQYVHLTELFPMTLRRSGPPSGQPTPGYFFNAFAEGARELVQWLEDVGHEASADPSLIATLEGQVRRFLGHVARFYQEDQDPIVRASMKAGGLQFDIAIPPRLRAALLEREPFLYAALNTPDGMCACQATPGVGHSR